MKITLREWIIFILLAAAGLGCWYKLSYPQFAFIDLAIDRKEALGQAEGYIKTQGVDPNQYLKAAVFESDDWADRYLQKTLGLGREEEFIQEHDFELFAWRIRFFKQLQKEEYIVRVSPKSGEILSYIHLIEDIEPRQDLGQEGAKVRAEEFLKEKYGLDLEVYEFNQQQIKRYDHRMDYSFSWEKKGVYVPWRQGEGGAKLLIAATVSGDEIREFYKSRLDIPEKFRRYIHNQLIFGQLLANLSIFVVMILVTWSIFIVVKAKHMLVIRLSKKWYLYLGLFLIILNLVYVINNIQQMVIAYPTSARLGSFMGNYLLWAIIGFIFYGVAFVMPGLAGESLCEQALPEKKYASFAHYLKSTFFSRNMAQSIILGYVLFFIFLGLQALLFFIGQRYLGVWREWVKLTQLSSAYLPFLSAFIIGASAALSEEITYRLFGISWGKRYLKSTLLAVILISLIWGFGHTQYPIFPVWFRGIEVGILGLLFGFIFLRYGLVCLIVAHYVFDVFWGTAAYILGKGPAYLFFGSICVLTIPLALAVIGFILNREEKEKEIKMVLDSTQQYNLNVLTAFISKKKDEGLPAALIKQELLRHNWDIALVDLAIGEVF